MKKREIQDLSIIPGNVPLRPVGPLWKKTVTVIPFPLEYRNFIAVFHQRQSITCLLILGIKSYDPCWVQTKLSHSQVRGGFPTLQRKAFSHMHHL